jgi:hypothetical protein
VARGAKGRRATFGPSGSSNAAAAALPRPVSTYTAPARPVAFPSLGSLLASQPPNPLSLLPPSAISSQPRACRRPRAKRRLLRAAGRRSTLPCRRRPAETGSAALLSPNSTPPPATLVDVVSSVSTAVTRLTSVSSTSPSARLDPAGRGKAGVWSNSPAPGSQNPRRATAAPFGQRWRRQLATPWPAVAQQRLLDGQDGYPSDVLDLGFPGLRRRVSRPEPAELAALPRRLSLIADPAIQSCERAPRMGCRNPTGQAAPALGGRHRQWLWP